MAENKCSLCNVILSAVSGSVGENPTEEKVREALGKVSSQLPKSIEGEVVDFVNAYGELIAGLLGSGVKSADVCSAIGVC